MPFVSTMRGAWPVSRFCSQISCPGAFRVQLPVPATSRGRVGIQLQPGRPRGGGVLDHQAGGGGRGRVGDAEHPGQALRVSSASILSISLLEASKTLVPVVPPCRLRYTCPKSAIRVGVVAETALVRSPVAGPETSSMVS